MDNELQLYTPAVKQIKEAILRSQNTAVKAVNKALISLYYAIGGYISANSRRGFWGTGALKYISEALQKELPGLRGFSVTSLKDMRSFYEQWSPLVNRQPLADDLQVSENKLLALTRQPSADEIDWGEFVSLPFSHHCEIIRRVDKLEDRLFYIHTAVTNSWSKYTLRQFIGEELHKKVGTMPSNFSTALPTAQMIKATKMFKDEYLMDFVYVERLGEDESDVDERIVEHQIVANIKDFILTFGEDFAFIRNQYRIEVAGEEMFVDLLFFNRALNCLVAVELKSGKFKSSYLGQLNTYLSALDATVRKPHENHTIGILLCREVNRSFVEFAIRDYDKPMGVAKYTTSSELPDKYRKALPPIESLQQLLDKSEDKNES